MAFKEAGLDPQAWKLPWHRRDFLGPDAPDMFLEPIAYDEFVANATRTAINRGQFRGKEAFSAIDNTGGSSKELLCHGSHVMPENLEGGALMPHQATWSDADNNVYRDGDPAVCFEVTCETAAFRGFFHPQRPWESGEYWSFWQASPQGKIWHGVPRYLVQELSASDTQACLYLVEKMFGEKPWKRAGRPLAVPEYRRSGSTPYKWAVRVGMDFLPPNVLIIDTDKSGARKVGQLILQGHHPLDIKKELHVNIDPLWGTWDITDHMFFREPATQNLPALVYQ